MTSPLNVYFITVTDTAAYLRCTEQEVEEQITRGILRLSGLKLHRRRRLVYAQDVLEYDKRRKEGPVIPLFNLPARTGIPNIVLLTPAIRPARNIPVPMMPRSKYFVYALRQPNGNPFYVGKGTGNRPDEHISEAWRGECICRKCKAIQLIHKMGRDVLITYEFETNDQKAALRAESKLIREWYNTYWLTNRNGNIYYDFPPPPPSPWAHMSRAAVEAYLNRMLLLPKERKAKIDEWREKRLDYLDSEWRRFRRARDSEEAERIDLERQELHTQTGNVYQQSMSLFSGSSTAHTVRGLEAQDKWERKNRRRSR